MNLSISQLYSVHPAVNHARAIINNLPEKTGHSIQDWIRILEKDGPQDNQQWRDWLKSTHKIGATTAWLIADRAMSRASVESDPNTYLKAAQTYVDDMFAGPRAALRPIYDVLIEGAQGGRDIRICPCKTMVPFYRQHVIAQIKPATQKRIDFGLALKGVNRRTPKRLIDTGGLAKGDRITHRIPLADPAEVDAGLWRWFETAYELDA